MNRRPCTAFASVPFKQRKLMLLQHQKNALRQTIRYEMGLPPSTVRYGECTGPTKGNFLRCLVNRSTSWLYHWSGFLARSVRTEKYILFQLSQMSQADWLSCHIDKLYHTVSTSLCRTLSWLYALVDLTYSHHFLSGFGFTKSFCLIYYLFPLLTSEFSMSIPSSFQASHNF